MQRNDSRQPSADAGVDVTSDSPLPDVPDAGDDSQPLASPDPVDFSTAGITADAALVAGTLNDGDERTLYEQALDSYEASDDQAPADQVASSGDQTGRRVRVYPANE